MQFIALHSGFGSEARLWHPAFVVLAPDEDAAPRSIEPIENADPQGFQAGRSLLEAMPDITAGRLALLSAPDGAGWLARADTGQVVFTPRGRLEEAEQLHWDQLNADDYGKFLIGAWLSEYDYDRRTLTVTWADPPRKGWYGILRSLVRDDRLSDPEG